MNYWFFFYRLWFWFKSLKFRSKKHRTLEEVALCKSAAELADNWSREALGTKNERIIIKGSSPSGDLILIDVTFGSKKSAIARILFQASDGKVFKLSNISGNVINKSLLVAGPLRLECREPFKRWRLTIRGTLFDNIGKPHTVRLLSWFAPTSDESYFLADLPSKKLAQIATINNCAKTAADLSLRQDFLQWGRLRAQIFIDNADPTEIDFRVIRIKTIAPFKHESTLLETVSVNLELGDRIFFAQLGFKNDESVCIGQIDRCDYASQTVASVSDDYSFITADTGETYTLDNVKMADNVDRDVLLSQNDVKIEQKQVLFDFNGTKGYALRISSFKSDKIVLPNDEISASKPSLTDYTATNEEKRQLVVSLKQKAAQDTLFTGGKGSNLAKLTQIQKGFHVPTGFVVTVTAFQAHLDANPTLKSTIEFASTNLKPSDSEGIAAFEKTVQSLLLKTKLSIDLEFAITNEFLQLYGGASPDNAIHVAVRSSAVGEDGTDLSSAGQLETFLEVPLSDVTQRVRECWASNFRREVVSYRLQNAQSINTPVAVVIQQMIVGGMAGVLFTNDPVKGDPNRLVINVIEGLGEALVSGQATPDEIVLTRNLEIISKPILCPFSDFNAIKLANAGLAFEKAFAAPQDVEFAVKNDKLYILQTRCITNLDLETDWEFEHEFDNALVCENDVMSTANVGEVLPQPLTPLGYSLLLNLYDRAINSAVAQIDNPTNMELFKRIETSFQITRQRVFLDLTEMYLRNWQGIQKDRVPEYALGGQKMFDPEHFELGRRRFGTTFKRSDGKSLLSMLKVMFIDSKTYCDIGKQILTDIADVEKRTSQRRNTVDEQIEVVKELQKYVLQAVETHTKASMFSSFTYVFVAMIVRGSPEGDLTPEILADIATIYGENPSKPISADVPNALKRIASAIIKNDHEAKFYGFVDGKEAFAWLEALNDETGLEAKKFMQLHGYRGFCELMLQGTAWKDDPSQVVTNIKALITQLKLASSPASPSNEKHEVLEGSVINRLKSTQITGIKRKFFQFFINSAHRGVFIREELKNTIVQATYAFRQACLRLGTIMFDECLLPNPRSILFLTLDEIKDLYVTKNPRILHRLRRREKILMKQAEHRYAYVNVGTPQPLEIDASAAMEVDIVLHGTAVCEGVVHGIARVAKSLQDAAETQPGEILITRYTDIYWSPFFPVIRGLITEIGGLLSHGSVVAREYGLPCVIAVENATELLKTGDEILVDATRGVVKRLKMASQ